MLRIRLAGEDAVLHPTGALFLSAQRTLLVADAHVGKAVSFRKLGVPVPSGTTGETLAKLDAALADTGAEHVVFLGDFLHSVRSHAAGTLAVVHAWRERHPGLPLTLVRGNHDDRAGACPPRPGGAPPPPRPAPPRGSLKFPVVANPRGFGPFALSHSPRP